MKQLLTKKAMIYLSKFKCFSWILLVLSPFYSFVQITLDSTDFASSGDTVRISESLPVLSGYDLTGANYSWDFSSLSPESQELKSYLSMSTVPILVNFSFGAFASSEYQASYHTESTDIPIDALNNFLPVNVEALYAYSKMSDSSINALGYSLMVDGQGVPFSSDTIEVKYSLPLQFNQIDSSVGYTNVDLNPFADLKFIQHRNRTTEVDGWGTITTPYGTFSVLRIKHEIIEIDSLYQAFSGTGSWIALPELYSVEYEWWAKGEKDPVLKVVVNEVSGNEVIQSVKYRDIYRGLDASTISVENDFIDVYPNPVKGKVFYHSKLPIQAISLKSLQGNTIINKSEIEVISGSIDLSLVNPGVYFLIIESNNSFYLKRIIVN